MGRKPKKKKMNEIFQEQFSSWSEEDLRGEVIRKLKLIHSLESQLAEDSKLVRADCKRFREEIEYIIGVLDIKVHDGNVEQLLEEGNNDEEKTETSSEQ